MIKAISVYNRFHMDMLVAGARTMLHERWHLISIYSPNGPNVTDIQKSHEFIDDRSRRILSQQGCFDIISLKFDDLRDDQVELCVKNGYNPTLFSKDQAKQVVDFIERVNAEGEDSVLVAQCDAGISRSGAIAKFTSDLLGISFNDNLIHPNKYVLKMLWEIIDERKATIRFKDFITKDVQLI